MNAQPANVPNLTATQAKSYLWGATGEQEWTPAITTGKCCSNSCGLFF